MKLRTLLSCEQPLDRVLGLLPDARPGGGGHHSARCPSHDDRHASLSVAKGVDGRVLLKCHAGCDTKDIAAALGLGMKDLFAAGDSKKKTQASSKPVTAYDYRDEERQLLSQVCRYSDKSFRQRRPDGRGGWIWDTTGIRRVLYRLPELLDAREVRPDDWVFIPEGEKDVDNLLTLGLVATTNIGGAGKWQEDYTETLAGRRVVVLPDNDDRGKSHGRQVLDSLVARGIDARLLLLPNLPPKGDVSDWIATGGSAEELLEMAEKATDRSDELQAAPRSFRELMRHYPQLRPPVLHGLLRRGETMNVIAPPKTGKSWLVTGLALSVATGRPWLGTFATEAGDVLIIDNELHGETSASRIPKVAAAMGMSTDVFADSLFVENLRGKLKDLINLRSYFDSLEPGRFRIIILDAFYRFMPPDTDENDNATMAQLYNQLDLYADRLGCCFVLIHHSTKGNQSGKAVTDVGAGAGSQSRATDTHLVLRQHEEDGAVVLDAAVRSWAPIDPICLRWNFPTWTPAPDLDPSQLRRPDGKKRERKEEKPEDPPEVKWDVDRFVSAFLTTEPQGGQAITDRAVTHADLSERRAQRLLRIAEAERKVHRWTPPNPNTAVRFATIPQPVTDTGEVSK